MTDPTKVINFGSLRFIVPSSASIKTLYKSITTGSNYYTLEEAGTDYMVPTNKKFWILAVIVAHGTTVSTPMLQKHTAADSGAGTELIRVAGGTTTGITPVFISIEAGKYINMGSSEHNTYVTVFGVELDV
jgi:hypothetical protein